MHNGYAFMIRQTTRPATGQCTLAMYVGFLISEPKHANCTKLAEVSNISHDSVNRFLLREKYEPHDLFVESSKTLNLTVGILSVDDTTLDKPYSHHMALVGYFGSGKHHKVVKGISLILCITPILMLFICLLITEYTITLRIKRRMRIFRLCWMSCCYGG